MITDCLFLFAFEIWSLLVVWKYSAYVPTGSKIRIDGQVTEVLTDVVLLNIKLVSDESRH